MRIFGIGDLHLSFLEKAVPGSLDHIRQEKPMAVFGEAWNQHAQKIYDNWTRTVHAEDLVLVPGDISWALTLEEARFDLDFLGSLPGTIIMIRGNHDYWWQGIGKVRQVLPSNVRAIQNDSFTAEGLSVAGSRGWICPGVEGFADSDRVIYLRELARLELSLKSLPRHARKVIVMMHYMPAAEDHQESGFIELMQAYGVDCCVYGHLHSWAHQIRMPEEKWGIRFSLVSADYVNFVPRLLWEG